MSVGLSRDEKSQRVGRHAAGDRQTRWKVYGKRKLVSERAARDNKVSGPLNPQSIGESPTREICHVRRGTRGLLFGTLSSILQQSIDRMRARHTAHATPTFPVYSAAFISPGDLILGGGGGASKTGIKNKLVRHLVGARHCP
jgi:hypothetical protein